MLVERIEWIGERIVIHLFDIDGSHETICLYPDEALAVLHWLQQQEKQLLALYEQYIYRSREDM
jgi:hypothetical protein